MEKTPRGELASRIRELLGRLEDNLGFKIKVAERSGSSLKSMFPLNTIWGGVHCGREDCIPCSQEGEEIGNCKMRNIVYESACKKCNPEVGNKGPLKNPCTNPPSLYVGETGRSLHERSREHWDSYRNGSKDSHILKHHILHHGGIGEPEMIFKVVGSYRSALSRQVGEAVKIKRRGGEGSLLNSKGEFNRCKITRLTLGEQSTEPALENQSMENEEQVFKGEQDGEKIFLKRREQADKRSRGYVGNYKMAPQRAKRTGSFGEEPPTKPRKKRKFELVGSRWGLEEGAKGTNLDVLVGTLSPKGIFDEKQFGGRGSEGDARTPLNLQKNEFRKGTLLDKWANNGEEDMSNGNEQGDDCGDLDVGIGDNNSMNLICDEQTQNITNGEATELV